jgi:pimeloyl-ACP methyl ester carboxylesterase
LNPVDISYSHFNGGGQDDGFPPLILIHGAGGSRLNWPAQIRRMKGVEVYGLDLPGHGNSTGEPGTSIEVYAQTILDWMNESAIREAFVAGHSMGGAITLTLALLAAEKIAGIVLVSTGAKLRVHPDILSLCADQKQFLQAAELITKWSFSENVDKQVQAAALKRLEEVKASVVHTDFSACDQFDLMGKVGLINVPTVVICGDEDRLTPVKYSKFLAEQIKGAGLILVPDAGHMVMLEKPEPVADAIRSFIREHSRNK